MERQAPPAMSLMTRKSLWLLRMSYTNLLRLDLDGNDIWDLWDTLYKTFPPLQRKLADDLKAPPATGSNLNKRELEILRDHVLKPAMERGDRSVVQAQDSRLIQKLNARIRSLEDQSTS